MSLIVAEGISKSWSDKDVLKNVSFSLAPGERVGLVGPNGEGKTTLLRIIAALEQPTEGKLQRRAALRIGYLPQDPPAPEAGALRQAMLDVFADLRRTEQDLQALAARMEQDRGDKRLLRRFGELQQEFEARGGYSYSRRIEQVLTGLNFPRDSWDRPLAQLSGGQRTRAHLARLLLEEPEVLLLDEPTNHLDLESVEWLERWLESLPGAMIIVSHDRYFLDRATGRTWEVSSASLESFRGSYSQYLTQRQERFKERLRRWEAQQEYVRQTEDFIRRFIAGQRSKEARGRRTRLERFLKAEAIPRPREHARITVRLKARERTGDFVLRLNELKVGYDPRQPLLTVEKLDIQRGRRVVIVGPNGCGKTTLLRTVMGELPPLSGTARLGANVRLGYISQTHAELSPSMTALEAVRQIDPSLTEERARTLLGSLLLSGEDAFKKITELSGGQRSRVVIARLMLQKANVLILDEPTNHLDIPSQEVLQDMLSEFDGTVIFVSHDRYLIQALATDIWAVCDGTITPLRGDWNRYLQWRDERRGVAGTPPQEEGPGRTSPTRAGPGKDVRTREDHRQRRRRANEVQKMQRRLVEVEQTIHRLEADLKALNDQISKAGEQGDVDRITRLGEEYSAADARLRELFTEWEKLSVELQGA